MIANAYKALIGLLLVPSFWAVLGSNTTFCKEEIFSYKMDACKAELDGKISTRLASAVGELKVQVKEEQMKYHVDLRDSIAALSETMERKFETMERKFEVVEAKLDNISQDNKESLEMLVIGGLLLYSLVLFVIFPATVSEPVTEFVQYSTALKFLPGILCGR